MKIKIINRSNYPLPEYATDGSAGMDIKNNLEYGFNLLPGMRLSIPTGLYMEIPKGFEGQIRPRSGLALRHGITVLNTPGTVDSDFRGEIKVILANTGSEPVKIFPGDRIAQIIFAKHERVEFEQVEVLQESDRGFGGFGSTGKS